MKNLSTVATGTHEGVVSQAGAMLLRITFRASFVMTIGVIALVGLWSVACVIGGASSAGGPLDLVAGWFSAVSGH